MGGVPSKVALAASEDAKESNELPIVQEVAPDLVASNKESDATPPAEPPLKGAPESATEKSPSDQVEETKQPDEELVQIESPTTEAEETKNDTVQESDEPKEEEAEAEADTETPAAEEEEENKRPPLTIDDIKTAPFDIRFPTTNQTKHCYTRYNEFHKCQKERGEGAPECEKYRRYYRSLCPSEWIEKWNEERELGIFPGPY